jgi:AcrR family transcriptional regulator
MSDLRDRLLESARKILLDEGQRNFSLRKIARETGVSATSIYLHFDSKDHLIHVLMEESIDQLNNRLEKSIQNSTDPIEKLNILARVYVEFALENTEEYQIIYMVSSDQMSRYPKEKFRKARRGYEIVTEVLEEGVRKNLLDEDRPRVAAYTFWAQLHGVISVVISRRLDNRLDQQEFIEQAIEHIIHGFHVRTALQTN